jgi:predicted nucleic acid-binding protein
MSAIVDTGPIVALLDRADRHHRWANECFGRLQKPLLVCEPVLSEAMFLLRDHARGQDILLELVERGALNIAFQMEEHIGTLRSLLRKYRDLPMSLADACLVRMAEIHERYAVLTLDSDFSVYRKHGRLPLMLIHPTIQ